MQMGRTHLVVITQDVHPDLEHHNVTG
jgi:hypothetical protein